MEHSPDAVSADEARINELLDEVRGALPRRPTAADLPALRDRGALIVDIRPVELRQRDGELSGALVVDRNVLEWRLDPTSPDRLPEATDLDLEVVVMCDEGYASSLAAASLQTLGLRHATDFDGGMQAVIVGERARERDGVGDTSSPPPPVACTLDATQLPGRLAEWHRLLVDAHGREDIDGGVRLTLDAATSIAELAALVRAEQECCAFFAFAITVDHRGIGLEVRAPADGLSLIDSLFEPTA